ncbi:hypothetical protein ILYODFUR_034341 [Ilyodon furcidens]|uniref:Uncharacterized protein n=1 Tax=Ilyodon furcidens TaxID=33524 RepID=A0ABV0VK48_9TELE
MTECFATCSISTQPLSEPLSMQTKNPLAKPPANNLACSHRCGPGSRSYLDQGTTDNPGQCLLWTNSRLAVCYKLAHGFHSRTLSTLQWGYLSRAPGGPDPPRLNALSLADILLPISELTVLPVSFYPRV